MTASSSDRIVSRHKETASRIIDGEAVILRPMDNMILSLNETGTRIWELLADSLSVEEIIQTICKEFDVEYEAATQDVVTFLDRLKKREVIRIDPSRESRA